MKKASVVSGVAALLALLLLTGCSWLRTENTVDGFSPASQIGAAAVPMEELRQKYTGYGFQALTTDAERRLYASLDEAANKYYATEFLSDKFDNMQRVSDIIELYKDDHPEVFWIDEAEPYYYSDGIGGLTLELHFKLESTALTAAQRELESAVQRVLANAPGGGTDYEKELYLHDWLIQNCAYDDEAVELHKSDQVRANEQNAYGALIEGRAVCEGYARAFQLLCSRLGVTCWVIQGQAVDFNVKGNVNHIWNCVQLDGSWYHVDVTWDDYETVPTPTDHYFYFNLTTDEITKDHTISPLFSKDTSSDMWYNGFVPQCDSTDYYYFHLNAMRVDDLDHGGYGEYLAQAAAARAPSCCYLIADNLDYEDTFDRLVQGYAYEWVSAANERNNYVPTISSDCKLSSNSDRRVVTVILDYE